MRRRLGWQPVNDHRSVCPKRWLLVREDVAKCAANLIAICTVVLRQTWQYGVNRRCVPPPFFFFHYPLIVCRVCVWGLLAQAEPSISESSRRGQNESHSLSPLGHRQSRSVFFFFRENPWPGLQEILVNWGLSERPPGGNTY